MPTTEDLLKRFQGLELSNKGTFWGGVVLPENGEDAVGFTRNGVPCAVTTHATVAFDSPSGGIGKVHPLGQEAFFPGTPQQAVSMGANEVVVAGVYQGSSGDQLWFGKMVFANNRWSLSEYDRTKLVMDEDTLQVTDLDVLQNGDLSFTMTGTQGGSGSRVWQQHIRPGDGMVRHSYRFNNAKAQNTVVDGNRAVTAYLDLPSQNGAVLLATAGDNMAQAVVHMNAAQEVGAAAATEALLQAVESITAAQTAIATMSASDRVPFALQTRVDTVLADIRALRTSRVLAKEDGVRLVAAEGSMMEAANYMATELATEDTVVRQELFYNVANSVAAAQAVIEGINTGGSPLTGALQNRMGIVSTHIRALGHGITQLAHAEASMAHVVARVVTIEKNATAAELKEAVDLVVAARTAINLLDTDDAVAVVSREVSATRVGLFDSATRQKRLYLISELPDKITGVHVHKEGNNYVLTVLGLTNSRANWEIATLLLDDDLQLDPSLFNRFKRDTNFAYRSGETAELSCAGAIVRGNLECRVQVRDRQDRYGILPTDPLHPATFYRTDSDFVPTATLVQGNTVYHVGYSTEKRNDVSLMPGVTHSVGNNPCIAGSPHQVMPEFISATQSLDGQANTPTISSERISISSVSPPGVEKGYLDLCVPESTYPETDSLTQGVSNVPTGSETLAASDRETGAPTGLQTQLVTDDPFTALRTAVATMLWTALQTGTETSSPSSTPALTTSSPTETQGGGRSNWWVIFLALFLALCAAAIVAKKWKSSPRVGGDNRQDGLLNAPADEEIEEEVSDDGRDADSDVDLRAYAGHNVLGSDSDPDPDPDPEPVVGGSPVNGI